MKSLGQGFPIWPKQLFLNFFPGLAQKTSFDIGFHFRNKLQGFARSGVF